MEPSLHGALGRAIVAALCTLASAVSGGPLSAMQGDPGSRAVADARAGEVRGLIVERGSARPIPGATVALEPATDDADAASRTVATDADGAYRFRDVPPGEYRLEVSRLGYRTMGVWVEVPAAWRIRRSLGLEVDPIRLEPLRSRVRRTAAAWPAEPDAAAPSPARSLARRPAARPSLDARVLLPADVEAMATLGEPDLFRALQRLPGVSGRGDYSAAPWTRGAPWGFTEVLLDGLPLYDPLHLGGAGTALTMDALEAAVLLPGARPASLSDGVAGTVQLVSRTARPEARTTIAASPVAIRARTERRFLADRVGVAITGRRSWWDLVQPGFLNGAAGPFDYHFVDLAGRADARLAPGTTLELGGLWEEDRIDGDIGELVTASRGRWGNRAGWVALERSLGSAGIRATAGRSAYSLRTSPQPWATLESASGRPPFDLVEIDLGRRLLRVEAGGPLERVPLVWSLGVEHVREGVEQFGSEAWDREAPGLEREAILRRLRWWAEGDLELGTVELAVGAAVDIAGDVALPGGAVRPSVRARWSPFERVALEAARSRNRQFAYPVAPAGRMFGPDLSVGHVWILAGDDRQALTSDVTALGLELGLAAGLTGNLTLWKRAVRGIWTRGVSTLVDGRREEAAPDGAPGTEDARGLEVTLRRAGGPLDVEVSYTWMDAEIGAGEAHAWPSPSDRRHSLDAILGARLARGLGAAALFRAESGWPYDHGPWSCPDRARPCALSGRPVRHAYERSPAYVSLDLLLDWTRRGSEVSWGLSVAVRNVLGRENAASYRSETCFGSELVSVVCETAVGAGAFSPGLDGFRPAVAVKVEF